MQHSTFHHVEIPRHIFDVTSTFGKQHLIQGQGLEMSESKLLLKKLAACPVCHRPDPFPQLFEVPSLNPTQAPVALWQPEAPPSVQFAPPSLRSLLSLYFYEFFV